MATPGDSRAEQGQSPNAEELSPPRLLALLPVPLSLFLATCVTTFMAGLTSGSGVFAPQGTTWLEYYRLLIQERWQDGLAYMLSLMGILLAHEMGHFLTAVWHRVPASLPFFLPMPLPGSFGTMGALIGLDQRSGNRRQVFDIGIAGPLAGLVVAIPVTIYGILHAAPVLDMRQSSLWYQDPLLIQWLIRLLRPEVTSHELFLNPYLLAGWVGFLVTGLNMMPVGQLDGGHVLYGLLGQPARYLARAFVFVAIGFVTWARVYAWVVMIVLVILIGIDHPPTRDDSVRMGRARVVLGTLSLAIPVLCFPPYGIMAVR